MFTAKKDPSIADAPEVLRYFTAVLRGEVTEAKVAERSKAGELLGKRFGVFEPQEKRVVRRRGDLYRQMDAALARMKEAGP